MLYTPQNQFEFTKVLLKPVSQWSIGSEFGFMQGQDKLDKETGGNML